MGREEDFKGVFFVNGRNLQRISKLTEDSYSVRAISFFQSFVPPFFFRFSLAAALSPPAAAASGVMYVLRAISKFSPFPPLIFSPHRIFKFTQKIHAHVYRIYTRKHLTIHIVTVDDPLESFSGNTSQIQIQIPNSTLVNKSVLNKHLVLS